MSKIRMFGPDDDYSKLKYYMLDVDVCIGGGNDKTDKGIPYYVADFPGYIHTIGLTYKSSLWAWPRDEDPQFTNLIPYNGYLGPNWSYEIILSNADCPKDGAYSYATGVIYRNGEQFYKKGCKIRDKNDISSISINIVQCLIKLQDHPLGLNRIDYKRKIIDQKVLFRNQEAIIDKIYYNGLVDLIPDIKHIKYFDIPEIYYKNNIVDGISKPWIYGNNKITVDLLDDSVVWTK